MAMNERVLFEAALEISDPGARKAFLDKACQGDAGLRVGVEALLKSHETAGSFLEIPAVDHLEAAIKHENIVQVYSVEENPLPYLVMEYIDGETLGEKLDASGPLETAEVLYIGRQTLPSHLPGRSERRCPRLHRLTPNRQSSIRRPGTSLRHQPTRRDSASCSRAT
ncbi:MAG: hypothetical protein H7Z17_17850 [Fuerstia sp.]|nr:hypothetical protein [Fuerstiella sp.]